MGLIRVSPKLPRILYKSEDNSMMPMYDGFISDHHGWCVIGGSVEDVEAILRSAYAENMPLGDSVKLGQKALGRGSNGSSTLTPDNLEVCVLGKELAARKFRRLSTDELRGMLDA